MKQSIQTGDVMKQSIRTGEGIYAEIKRMEAAVMELDQALDEIKDDVGKDSLPYKVLTDTRTNKMAELQAALDRKYLYHV